MSETSHAILCGLCKSPITHRVETDPEGQAGCASCDNWAEKDEVIKIASEYVTDEAQMVLNRKMLDVARGSKIMTFDGKTTNNKTYRFITDGKI